MKLIHTSDWHLGRFLLGKSRAEEQAAFLSWLSALIREEKADLLIAAGDIFETHTPSNAAQKLYYDFLSRTSSAYTVIIGGNHDSPSLIAAPKNLLKTINVYAVGDLSEDIEGGVILIERDGVVKAIVCAAAYLPTPQDTLKRFSDMIAYAEYKQREIISVHGVKAPIIAVGHLSAAGLDGVWRNKYEGLKDETVDLTSFIQKVDYFALGHIHSAMTVNKAEHFRYSGSPIDMNPMQTHRSDKKVIVVEFKEGERLIKEVFTPVFQNIINIEGSFDKVYYETESLIRSGVQGWLLIRCSGSESYNQVKESLMELTDNSGVEIIHIEKLEEIEPMTVGNFEDLRTPNRLFQRFLDARNIAQEEQEELITAFNEILRTLDE
ncbi:MAG: exonuclease subunit SbcD [Deferribacteraceae bacterium]|jgi:exonuclease SbcD|nr:exonuclease subunit SbcD [Deferribacteraceae bacterium]